jgi:hypothetical protein
MKITISEPEPAHAKSYLERRSFAFFYKWNAGILSATFDPTFWTRFSKSTNNTFEKRTIFSKNRGDLVPDLKMNGTSNGNEFISAKLRSCEKLESTRPVRTSESLRGQVADMALCFEMDRLTA